MQLKFSEKILESMFELLLNQAQDECIMGKKTCFKCGIDSFKYDSLATKYESFFLLHIFLMQAQCTRNILLYIWGCLTHSGWKKGLIGAYDIKLLDFYEGVGWNVIKWT